MSNRIVVEKFWDLFQNGDADAAEVLFHPDVVVTYPQSGEVIRGRENLMETLRNYPTNFPTGGDDVILDTTEKISAPSSPFPFGMSAVTIVEDGELIVGQAILTYPNGDTYHTCSIFKVRSRLIAEETTYFAKSFEAPKWRSEWVEST